MERLQSSPLFCSFNNEDPKSEIECLNFLGKTECSVLTICGGGDTTTTLLFDRRVKNVVSLDLNEFQLNLLHLKVAIMQSSIDVSQINQIFFRQGNVSGDDRINAFTAEVSPILSEKQRDFWIVRNKDLVRYGLFTCGRIDLINEQVRDALKAQGVTFEKLLDDADVREKIVSEHDLHFAIRTMDTTRNFPPEIRTRIAKLVEKLLVRHQEGYIELLKQPSARSNWLLWIAFEGKLPRLPWITEYSKQTPSTLESHAEEVMSYLQKHPELKESFDLITLSNIFDWIEEDAVVARVAEISKYLKHGGLLLLRRTEGCLFECLNKAGLTIPEDLNSKLYESDETPFFFRKKDSIVAGQKK